MIIVCFLNTFVVYLIDIHKSTLFFCLTTYYSLLEVLFLTLFRLFSLFLHSFFHLDASVKDMEAAAIAWTTELTGTPFIALKVVTDIVDGGRPTHEEFMENLATAATSLQNTIFRLLDFIIGRKMTEL